MNADFFYQPDDTDGFGPIFPDQHERTVVHPLSSLPFVMLPASGRYVPSGDYTVQFDDDAGLGMTVVDRAGHVVAHATRTDGTQCEPVADPQGRRFAESCAGHPQIAACPPGGWLEEVVDLLAEEVELAERLATDSGSGLVWCTVDGSERGQWMVESLLDASDPQDREEVVAARPDAAYFWLSGTRHPFVRGDKRLTHAGRIREPLTGM